MTVGAARAQADILPGVSISFAPVGLTMNQTARLNLINTGVPNGMLINWRFIDASGLALAQSLVTLPLGKIVRHLENMLLRQVRWGLWQST